MSVVIRNWLLPAARSGIRDSDREVMIKSLDADECFLFIGTSSNMCFLHRANEETDLKETTSFRTSYAFVMRHVSVVVVMRNGVLVSRQS